ncbi:hypothetical protein J4476_02785 [Candidatus Woesearchaeota archaeon]|nr:MAG: hypothetical protein QT09_C0007G0025 [archaeon GW2011_AR18]MBS3161595.1 hypothetical protein [Candidatus Woesearchaeota archaeon]HIH25477.1 hypothetical protein [Nanoarchaeota archaeon]
MAKSKVKTENYGVDPDRDYTFDEIKRISAFNNFNLFANFFSQNNGVFLYMDGKVKGKEILDFFHIMERRVIQKNIAESLGMSPSSFSSNFGDVFMRYVDVHNIGNFRVFIMKDGVKYDDMISSLSEICHPYLAAKQAPRKNLYQSRLCTLLLESFRRKVSRQHIELGEISEIVESLSNLLSDEELVELRNKAGKSSHYDPELEENLEEVVEAETLYNNEKKDISVTIKVHGETIEYALDNTFVEAYKSGSMQEFMDTDLPLLTDRLSKHLNSRRIGEHMNFYIDGFGDVTINSGVISIETEDE